MLDDVRFALVDLETTGGQAANDQIMEVAVRQIDFSGSHLLIRSVVFRLLFRG